MTFTDSLFSCSVVSDSLWPHGLQNARPSCPSLSPRACSNSCSLSWWRHPTILSSVVPFSCLLSFLSSRSFLRSWFFILGGQSFSISPSNEYSGLISFRTDWFDLSAAQGDLKSHLQNHRLIHLYILCMYVDSLPIILSVHPEPKTTSSYLNW